jgi:hypothetical protein
MIREAIVQAHGDSWESAARVMELFVGVEGPRVGDFMSDAVELIDEVRVELQSENHQRKSYPGSEERGSVVSLPSLSLLMERLTGDGRLAFQRGGSRFSVAMPSPTSSLIALVGLRPRCLGVVCVLSFAATDFKSSIMVKNPSRTPSAIRLPATKI